MRLVLVRHGQTTSNVKELLDTAEPGADLTDLGRAQAEALVEALADEQIEALYVSSLVRTQQTAAPLAAARGLEPIVRPGIREVQAGEVEMRGDRDSIRHYLEVVVRWFRGDVDARMPGAETGREVLERFDRVVGEAAASGVRTVAMVSHGAILRYWSAMRATNIDAAVTGDSRLSNTGVIVLEGWPGDGWRVLSWEGTPVGGPEVADIAHDGPTG